MDRWKVWQWCWRRQPNQPQACACQGRIRIRWLASAAWPPGCLGPLAGSAGRRAGVRGRADVTALAPNAGGRCAPGPASVRRLRASGRCLRRPSRGPRPRPLRASSLLPRRTSDTAIRHLRASVLRLRDVRRTLTVAVALALAVVPPPPHPAAERPCCACTRPWPTARPAWARQHTRPLRHPLPARRAARRSTQAATTTARATTTTRAYQPKLLLPMPARPGRTP